MRCLAVRQQRLLDLRDDCRLLIRLLDAESSSQHVAQGVERRGAFERQSPAFEPDRVGGFNPPAKLQHETRLADSRIPRQKDHASLARPGLLEAVLQGLHLALAAHEIRQTAFELHVEPCHCVGCGKQLPGWHRVRLPLEGEGAEGAHTAVSVDQTMSGLRDHDLVGASLPFEASRHVRGVSHRGVVHPQVVADGSHHHDTGIQPHPEGDPGIASPLLGVVPRVDPAAKLQRGEHRAPGMVLMSDGGAEQRHEAIAQELVHVAFVAVNGIEGQLEELVQDIVHGLGSELLGHAGRVRQIAEQHGDLLAFTLEDGTGREDLFGEMRGGVRIRIEGPRRGRRLRGRCGRLGALTCGGESGPDQSPVILVPCLGMVEENGFLEVLERLVIEVELALEGAIRNPAPLAKQAQDLVEHLVEVHVSILFDLRRIRRGLLRSRRRTGVPSTRLNQPGALRHTPPATVRMMPQAAALCRVLRDSRDGRNAR